MRNILINNQDSGQSIQLEGVILQSARGQGGVSKIRTWAALPSGLLSPSVTKTAPDMGHSSCSSPPYFENV